MNLSRKGRFPFKVDSCRTKKPEDGKKKSMRCLLPICSLIGQVSKVRTDGSTNSSI